MFQRETRNLMVSTPYGLGEEMRNFSKCCNARLIHMKLSEFDSQENVNCGYCSRCGTVYRLKKDSPTGSKIIEEPDEWE